MQLGPSNIAGRNTNDIETLQNNLTVSYKVKYALFIWPNNSTSKSLPRKNVAYDHWNTIIWMFIVA